MLDAGTIVADKYRLERVLGRGGMGTVIAARHVQLGTSFALKFLHRSILENETVPERFLREARATATLQSEHVCRVFDVGSFEGAPYLVMELLEGTDLERVLRREGRLSPRVACSYLIQACAGVADAHAAQIVHRDLKPGNLFLLTRPDGTALVKVLDFGIAKAPPEAELGLTGTDAILGSPAYMSLEQLRSSRLVDARSDIWSLGVILFELLAGRRPFTGEGLADLALRIAMEPTPRLPGGPAELDRVIGRCLAREPAQRYQDVGALALALAPFAGEPERRLAESLAYRATDAIIVVTSEAERSARSAASLTVQDAELPPDGATTMQTAGAIEHPRPARRSRSRIGLAALAALVAGGLSLGIAATRGEAPAPAPAPAVAA
ncbi:MAG TPA: serine/threonine-protein kinase, partial [Kofleriaceae bacterium]|nr:serine/threonine-protein kinase [Kofleriaceae bacterium]